MVEWLQGRNGMAKVSVRGKLLNHDSQEAPERKGTEARYSARDHTRVVHPDIRQLLSQRSGQNKIILHQSQTVATEAI